MKRLLIYMVCTSLFSGCSPDDRLLPATPAAIRFVSGVSVEVSKATGPVSGKVLLEDSRISLLARSEQNDGTGKEILMNNLPGTVGAEGTIDYNPAKYYESGKKYVFYACWPYSVSLAYTDATAAPSLKVGLGDRAGAQDDYLWASLEVTPHAGGSTDVSKLTFRHALCQIRVRIWNGSTAEALLNGITLTAPGNGTLSLGDGSWTDIVAGERDPGFPSFTLCRPPVPMKLPQDAFYEVSASLLQLPVGAKAMKKQVFSITIDGKTFKVSPSTPVEGWESGHSYLYTVWYATDGITFKGTVGPWQPVDGGSVDTEE